MGSGRKILGVGGNPALAQLDLHLLVAQRGGTVVLSRALLVESGVFQSGRNPKATLDVLRGKNNKTNKQRTGEASRAQNIGA